MVLLPSIHVHSPDVEPCAQTALAPNRESKAMKAQTCKRKADARRYEKAETQRIKHFSAMAKLKWLT
jgi:hypothetical protein